MRELYDMPLWRPPSEGRNLILQATIGCSFNACTFCSMYRTKTYRAKPLDELFQDIEDAAHDWPDVRRVFLADGDALCLPTEHLLQILDKLGETFPDLQRVSAYATPRDLTRKSVEELAMLKAKRLNLVYLGIESGSDALLKRIHKGSAKNMGAALDQANQAGLKVSATVILGLGGKALWREHIEATADLINAHPPTFLSTLQLGLEPGQDKVFFDAFARKGADPFEWQDDAGVLKELAMLLQRLTPPRPVIFRSNHASNALALAGTLPKDGPRLLQEVRNAEADQTRLRPRTLRSL